MAHAGDEPSLHRRLMQAVVRGARAQEDSRVVIKAHRVLDAQVRDTLAAVRQRRERIERGRGARDGR